MLTNGPGFSNLTVQQQLDFIQTVNYDFSGCLSNCSNKGTCLLNTLTNRYECFCETDYFGSACKLVKRLCLADKQCLQGHCVDTLLFNNQTNKTEYSFECVCNTNYYGSRCEFEIDLCENKTCSSNGVCFVNSSKEAECKCFNYYSGVDCEIKSDELALIHSVIRISSIIATIIIVAIYLLFFLNDVSSLFFKIKKIEKPKDVRIKYVYTN